MSTGVCQRHIYHEPGNNSLRGPAPTRGWRLASSNGMHGCQGCTAGGGGRWSQGKVLQAACCSPKSCSGPIPTPRLRAARSRGHFAPKITRFGPGTSKLQRFRCCACIMHGGGTHHAPWLKPMRPDGHPRLAPTQEAHWGARARLQQRGGPWLNAGASIGAWDQLRVRRMRHGRRMCQPQPPRLSLHCVCCWRVCCAGSTAVWQLCVWLPCAVRVACRACHMARAMRSSPRAPCMMAGVC